jgi:hypothetical protein
VLTIRPRRRGPHAKAQQRRRELFWFKLELILEGARRHGRPFGITRFRFAQSEDAERFVAAAPDWVRMCDAIGAIANSVLVAWDDADRDAVEIAATRLLESVPYGALHRASVAFPSDGLTVSALMEALDTAGEGDHRAEGAAPPLEVDSPPSGQPQLWRRAC